MIGEIAVVPQMDGPARKLIRDVVADIAAVGLEYEVGATGTCVEGDLESILGAVRQIDGTLREHGVTRALIELRLQIEPHPESIAHQVEGVAVGKT